MSPWHIPCVAPPAWTWKTSSCARVTQPGALLWWHSWFKTELSPRYPNSREELEDTNPALTSSLPHESQLGSRLGDKLQTTVVWCIIPKEDARATFSSTARGWECPALPEAIPQMDPTLGGHRPVGLPQAVTATRLRGADSFREENNPARVSPGSSR